MGRFADWLILSSLARCLPPFALVLCKRQCNGRNGRSVGAGGLGGFPPGVGSGVERQARERVQSALHVQELRIGIDVRGEARVGMPHGGLGGAERHPAPAQERSEGRAEGVNVEGAAPLVSLGDPGGVQVAVEESSPEPTGHRRRGSSPGRRAGIGSPCWRASAWSVASLSASQRSEVGGEVGPNERLRCLPGSSRRRRRVRRAGTGPSSFS